ncbi:spindle and centriole-associated protein 1 [Bombina bombina]|uniref:spindle and centriole-associated protein 1 n=1 Tax=Bombina bombina TaxID=8345 RepID=UPI00235AF7D1|nr:spindle and centriole-associated protein 1 [Bombina bombina]
MPLSVARRSHSLAKGHSKPRKKKQQKQEWDSTVNDLSVHRATVEELMYRHEIHKSKNQWLAHWELQNMKNKQENRQTPDPVQRKRVLLMKEILSDQYEMNEVLERSDRALAVVKDLFGDAPRRHTGFPNVTMAPTNDPEVLRAPIIQRKDPPTQLSILSESVMDPQALNEVEQSVLSEHSEEELEESLTFQSKLHTEPIPQARMKKTSQLISQSWADKTPCKQSGALSHSQTALNATEAVKRVRSRLPIEEQEEVVVSGEIGQVINPNPPQRNHRPQSKAKKARVKPSSVHSKDHSLSNTFTGELPCNSSSLNQMIQDVQNELDEYERQRGREVMILPKTHGLTGFTLSLVSSLRRLVSYLKEWDVQLHTESEERRRLHGELAEQRILIDALTAEILKLKEGNAVTEVPYTLPLRYPNVASIQKCVRNGESRSTLSDTVTSSPDREHVFTPANSVYSQDLKIQHEKKPSPKHTVDPVYQDACHVDKTKLGRHLPSHIFEPAVMLSPPRQRTQCEFANESRLLDTSATVPSSPTDKSSVSIENYSGNKPLDHPKPPDNAQESTVCERSHQTMAYFDIPQSYPCHQGPHHHLEPVKHQSLDCNTAKEEIKDAYTCNTDLATRMAELTLQNSILKTQLERLGFVTTDGWKSPSSPEACKENKKPTADSPQTNLELRIAEMNRQRAEARKKLLALIEEQKQSIMVSPPLSPIPPKNDSPATERTSEVVAPVLHLTNPSQEDTKSPVSGTCVRRPSDITNRAGSYPGGRPGSCAQWPKVAKAQREEAWFALSSHIS